jgi:transcriptional regulator with XRE-family HTH domain
MNHPPQTWRELLERLTERPAERQRVADVLGVTPYTVTRWVEGRSEPRMQNLKRLPEVFPGYTQLFSELIQAELVPNAPLPSPLPGAHPQHEVPAEYLVHVLAAYATSSGPFRSWSMRTLTLQQAIEQLDPDQVGMEITLVQCVPPTPGQCVRSLCERMGIGTAPWDNGVRRRLLFLGAESLSGWTVGRGEPGVVQDMEQNQGPLPFRAGLHEKSAVAWPLQRAGKLAGCLLISSTQVNYFTPAHLSYIEIYANALALSFGDEEFYELHRIALHEMPVLSRQQEYTSIAQLRDRVAGLRREQAYSLSEAQAEVLGLQQMEVELLTLSSER